MNALRLLAVLSWFVLESSTLLANTERMQFAEQELRGDLDELKAKLKGLHPGLFRYATKNEIEDAFRRLRVRIGPTMSDVDFFREIASLSSVIQDGHTEFLFSPSAQRDAETLWPLLPLKLRLINQRLYVLRDYATADQALAGAEIRGVNGKPARELVEKLISMSPRDGGVATGPRRWLEKRFRSNTFLAVETGCRPKIDITFAQHESDPSRTTVLTGLPLPELARRAHALHPRDWATLPAYELKFLNDGAIALLTVRSFEDDPGLPPLAGFFAAAFGSVEERRSRILIIDVRDNGGGSDHLGKLLLAHLLDHPFDYYKGIFVNAALVNSGEPALRNLVRDLKFEQDSEHNWRLASHPTFGVQHAASTGSHGTDIVLMNGGSFSTTAEFLAILHANHRATFVGEESGGAYCGNTSGASFVLALPNTGVRLEIPLMRYELAAQSEQANRGIMPDAPVSESIDDLLSERDRYLDMAVKLATAEFDKK